MDTRGLRPNNAYGLHGWIEATNLDMAGDAASLVVATAEPPVFVRLPTEPPALLFFRAGARPATVEMTRYIDAHRARFGHSKMDAQQPPRVCQSAFRLMVS